MVGGFSMSDFDAFAQMQFAAVAQARNREKRPLRVVVVDPCLDPASKDRFRRVFGEVEFEKQDHCEFAWGSLG